MLRPLKRKGSINPGPTLLSNPLFDECFKRAGLMQDLLEYRREKVVGDLRQTAEDQTARQGEGA